MTDYLAAIVHLLPGAQLGITANDYDTIEWADARPMPSRAECDAVWPAVQAARAAAATAEQTAAANGATINTQAEAALANLRAYIALASPTSAQTVAAVKIICRVLVYLVRVRIGKLESLE